MNTGMQYIRICLQLTSLVARLELPNSLKVPGSIPGACSSTFLPFYAPPWWGGCVFNWHITNQEIQPASPLDLAGVVSFFFYPNNQTRLGVIRGLQSIRGRATQGHSNNKSPGDISSYIREIAPLGTPFATYESPYFYTVPSKPNFAWAEHPKTNWRVTAAAGYRRKAGTLSWC